MKWITASMALILNVIVLLRYLTLSQNNHYHLSRSDSFKKTILYVACIALLALVPFHYVAAIAYLFGAVVLFVLERGKRTKFKWTDRSRHYFILTITIFIIFQLTVCLLPISVVVFYGCTSFLTVWSFLFVKMAECSLNGHFEKKNKVFVQREGEKFASSGTKLIAITGSYGKTCCKNILNTLLAGSYSVGMTEGNYNTPMGVALAMQKSSGGADYFIAEFGARKEGDITELCSCFHPYIGIITGVCMQHVGVFGSLHTIYNEKFQLAKMTDKEGFCAFGNNLYAKKMFKEFDGNKITVGLCEDFFADNVVCGVGKTTFTLHIYNEKRTVNTVLCGKQAVENILLCAAVAYKIGVSAQEIFERIPLIKQIPHRLEYSFSNGIHILDDSYNSNPVGVRYALDYLKIYPSPRIVVAQGVIELGKDQKTHNTLIGEEIAKVADCVVLLGVNRKSIEKGLNYASFNKKVIKCRNLKQVTKNMKKLAQPGATVLFQNDLPEL